MRRCVMFRQSFATFVVAVTAGLTGSSCGGEVTVGDTIAVTVGDSVETTTLDSTSMAESSVAEAVEMPMFDFSTADDVGEWSVVNDSVMGGVSTGQLMWEDGALVFTGELSLDNNGGFASVRSPFIDPTAAERWGRPRRGLSVELRGDGRVWAVEVRMDGEDGGWISEITTSAEEITAVELPWESFEPVTRFLDPRNPVTPLDPTQIVSVAFYLVDGIEAPFRLELHSIFQK